MSFVFRMCQVFVPKRTSIVVFRKYHVEHYLFDVSRQPPQPIQEDPHIGASRRPTHEQCHRAWPPRWHVGEAFANAVLQAMGISWRCRSWGAPSSNFFQTQNSKNRQVLVLAIPTFLKGYSCKARRKKNGTFPHEASSFFG